MKKTLMAVLVLSLISSFFMVRFYFASVEIYHEYVHENAFIYINSLNSIENLPEWTAMKGLWHDTQIDFLIRFIFMIVAIVVLSKLIRKTEGSVTFLIVALVLGIVSSAFIIFYILASSDIYNEFVNNTIFTTVNSMANIEPFPEWASCSEEWVVLIVDFILRAMFMLYISVLLIKFIFTKEKQAVPVK